MLNLNSKKNLYKMFLSLQKDIARLLEKLMKPPSLFFLYTSIFY